MALRKFFVGVRSGQSERYFRRHYDAGENYVPPAIGDQYIPIQFTLLDNPEFRNGLMTKARFRTYLLLRRYVVRARSSHDPVLHFRQILVPWRTRSLDQTGKVGRKTESAQVNRKRSHPAARKGRRYRSRYDRTFRGHRQCPAPGVCFRHLFQRSGALVYRRGFFRFKR